MAAGLLLLCVGSVLSWVGAEDAYARLPEGYRSGVDLALEQLNSHPGVQSHFRFLRSLVKTEMEVKLRFIPKMVFNVGRIFVLNLKVWVKVRLVLFFFNLKSWSRSCCLHGRLPHTFHICFGPKGIFKLLHVHSRMSLPFEKMLNF